MNKLPKETLDALSTISGKGVTIVDGEDCEAIWETSHHTESNSDDCCRSEPQCHYSCQCQTWFKTPGCSGGYSVNGVSMECCHSANNTLITLVAVDIWRRDRRNSINLLLPLT
jgi:hypothetical protein